MVWFVTECCRGAESLTRLIRLEDDECRPAGNEKRQWPPGESLAEKLANDAAFDVSESVLPALKAKCQTFVIDA